MAKLPTLIVADGQALYDGLLDAALLARYELSARPPERQWNAWRASHPRAAHWNSQVQALPAMQATIPHV